MKLNSLHLQNFRSYTDQKFEFTSDKVIFCGPNGKGKTNVLEAITLLSVGKSWRETSGGDLIESGQDSALITGVEDSKDAFKVMILPRSRRFSRNEKSMPRTRFFGQIPTLLFCPEFLDLFSGPKKSRQAFFDRFLVQVSPAFRDSFLRANKAHTQKTKLLKQSEDLPPHILADQVRPWDQILAEHLPLIFAERTALKKNLNPFIEAAMSSISGTHESAELHISYSEDFDPSVNGILEFFRHNFDRSCAARKNFCHPGTQDIGFNLRGKPVQTNASRGEMRSVLLALLAAQKNFLQTHHQVAPILLLDDVFSELDAYRQTHLADLCEGCQTFFTTTHAFHFEGFEKNHQIIDC